MRAVVSLALAAAMACGAWHCSPAHAGPGGSIAMPGPCDYPGVSRSHYGAGVFVWYCDFPVEENCSHWHGEGRGFNAGGPTGSGEYGFDFAGFGINIPGGILGGGDGFTGYLYPDNTSAPWPNPPGAWKSHLVPRCPPEHNHPPAPVIPPPDLAPASDPAPPPFTGAVTNPDNPNPDATENSHG